MIAAPGDHRKLPGERADQRGEAPYTGQATRPPHGWIVRRPPLTGLTPSAHDVAREWRVMQALQYSAVPVPPQPVASNRFSIVSSGRLGSSVTAP